MMTMMACGRHPSYAVAVWKTFGLFLSLLLFLLLLFLEKTPTGATATTTTAGTTAVLHKTAPRATTTATTTDATPTKIDLSYLHNVPAEKIAQVIQEQIQKQQPSTTNDAGDDDDNNNNEKVLLVPPPKNVRKVFSIDVSNSALGDSGFRKILNALLPKPTTTTRTTISQQSSKSKDEQEQEAEKLPHKNYDETTNATSVKVSEAEETAVEKGPREACSFNSLHLACRMNDLTPLSAKSLLTRIMDSSSSGDEQESSTPGTTKTSISSLDLGWNHFSTDELSGDNDNYHHLLEHLLAHQTPQPTTSMAPITPTTTTMLTHLAMEHCGLGPATCRALAKGILSRHGLSLDDDEAEEDGGRQKKKRRKKKKTTNSNPVDRLSKSSSPPPPPLSLHLAGNRWIGDAGTAALAAAFRRLAFETWNQKQEEEKKTENDNDENNDMEKGMENDVDVTVLDTLDLSDCGIGDAGAQALALALEEQQQQGGSSRRQRRMIAVRHLILSGNQITEEGAMALGRALILLSSSSLSCGGMPECLDLSNNPIGDRGASVLAAVWGQGWLPRLMLRSCQINADGAAAFGKALALVMTSSSLEQEQEPPALSQRRLCLDLSGNALGRLRGKTKSSSGGGMYSASRLRSTATATAASYMNRIKQGVQDSLAGGSSRSLGDSDDEEDELAAAASGGGRGRTATSAFATGSSSSGTLEDEQQKRCGARALSTAFLDQNAKLNEEYNDDKTAGSSSQHAAQPSSLQIEIGLRHCFLDHGAADALAAVIVEAADHNTHRPDQRGGGRRRQRSAHVTLDVSLNTVLEEGMVAALHNRKDDEDDAVLLEMAERYMDLWHAIQESKQRAAEARARARAQVRAENVDPWDTRSYYSNNGDDDDDEDYEVGDDDEEEEEDYEDEGDNLSYRSRRRRHVEEEDEDWEDEEAWEDDPVDDEDW